MRYKLKLIAMQQSPTLRLTASHRLRWSNEAMRWWRTERYTRTDCCIPHRKSRFARSPPDLADSCNPDSCTRYRFDWIECIRPDTATGRWSRSWRRPAWTGSIRTGSPDSSSAALGRPRLGRQFWAADNREKSVRSCRTRTERSLCKSCNSE